MSRSLLEKCKQLEEQNVKLAKENALLKKSQDELMRENAKLKTSKTELENLVQALEAKLRKSVPEAKK